MARGFQDLSMLNALNRASPGHLWLITLAQAGVRSADEGPGAALYAMAGSLAALEDACEATGVPDRWHFEAPPRWWLWVPLLYTAGFFVAAQSEHYEDRLKIWMWALVIPAMIAVALMLTLRFRHAYSDHNKRLDRTSLTSEVETLRTRLLQCRDEFVAAGSG